MLTREQKAKQIKEGEKILDSSKGLIFIDFSGIGVEELKKLRRNLKNFGAKLKVIKKKLLRIAFQSRGFDFNPEQFESQLGTIFSENPVEGIAAPVYKSGLKILGGYDLAAKSFLDADRIKFIGQLPSREVLLGQLVGMLATPIKMLMYIMQERAKKVGKQ